MDVTCKHQYSGGALFNLKTSHRLLLVCFDNLGDLVFTSAIATNLKILYPDLQIDLWCKSYTSDIGHLIPGIKCVFACDPFWDRSPGRKRGGILKFLSTLLKLRRRAYDVVICGSTSTFAALTTYSLSSQFSIGRAKKKNARFFSSSFTPLDNSQPVLTDYLRLLQPFGKTAHHSFYHLDRERLPNLPPKNTDITFALHPFAGSPDRCMRIDHWIALAHQLVLRGKVFFCGTSQELTRLRNHLSRDVMISNSSFAFADTCCGSLLDLFAEIKDVKLFVGHDSGPLHIAAGLGIPVIGIFAPGQPQRTFPQGRGPGYIVYGENPESITVDMVLEAINRALNHKP